MFQLDDNEISFIGIVLEGFFYGFYSGIVAMYLQYQVSKKGTDKKQNIVFYSLCALYVLSVALFAADITLIYCQLLSKPIVSALHISFVGMTLFGCCDFIAQFILIYRCWIVWGCNSRVVIIPSILTFAFLGQSTTFFDWLVSNLVPLAVWLAAGSSAFIASGQLVTPAWGYVMTVLSLALSLAVNALVTGLIVFRIFKVFREVKATEDQSLGATGGSKLRRTILILIESGMGLFSIQLARVVVTVVETYTDYGLAFTIIVAIHEMLTGITPTIILVRTSMGLSFHDEKSMEEFAIGSLRFTSNHSNAVQETGCIGIVGQDNRDDDLDIGIERSNDINIVDR